jgi:Tol biopolymer transport system component
LRETGALSASEINRLYRELPSPDAAAAVHGLAIAALQNCGAQTAPAQLLSAYHRTSPASLVPERSLKRGSAFRFPRLAELLIAATLSFVAAAVIEVVRILPFPFGGGSEQVATREITTTPQPLLSPTASENGEVIVYAAHKERKWDVFRQVMSSGRVDNLTMTLSGDSLEPAVSPDGTQIAFHNEHVASGISILDESGAARPLTERGHDPVFTPDGHYLIYSDERVVDPLRRNAGQSGLYRVEVSTGRIEEIFSGDATQPRPSPDGRFIAYCEHREGRSDISIYDTRTRDRISVTNSDATDSYPTWTNLTSLLFLSDRNEGKRAVWRVQINPANGTVSKPTLLRQAKYDIGSISASGDGKLVFYTAPVELGAWRLYEAELHLTPAVGMSQVNEVMTDVGDIRSPSISPTGKQIVVVTAQPENLVLLDLHTHQTSKLTNDPPGVLNRSPRWSPDGSQIAYYSNRSGIWQIWLTSPDGRNTRILPSLSGDKALYPVWLHDSKHIAVSTSHDSSAIINTDLSSADGTPTRLPLLETGRPFAAWSFSFDDQVIAGIANDPDGESGGIFTYDLRNRSYQMVSASGQNPQFLQDGTRLLYSDRGRLFLADTRTHRRQEIGAVSPGEIAGGFDISPDDRKLYFTSLSRRAILFSMPSGKELSNY